MKLSEQPPHYLHYLGVSFGLTKSLHKFWKNNHYIPVYLRQTANDLTGEHTCVMLKVLEGRESKWLSEFANDFHKRFLSLLSYEFKKFTALESLNVIESAKKAEKLADNSEVNSFRNRSLTKEELDSILSPFDLKRLDSYSNNLLDYHVIVDLLPKLAMLYFSGKLSDGVSLSSVQACILLAIGLQHKNIDDITKELNLPSNQTIAMFSKIMRKFSIYFREVLSKAIGESLPEAKDDELASMNGEIITTYNAAETIDKMEDDLEIAGNEAISAMKEKQKELINSLNLNKYAIDDNQEEWSQSKKDLEKAIKNKGSVAIKSNKKRKQESAEQIYNEEMGSAKKSKKKSKK